MAGFTALVALGTAGLSAAQAIKASETQRAATKAAETAATALEGQIQTGVPNVMAGLQLPTKGAELMEASGARAITGATEAAQEAGAAGVIGGVGRITQAAGGQAAQQAAQLDRMQMERDKAVLAQEQSNELLKYQGLMGLSQAQLTGASQAAADAYAAQQAAVGGAVESLTSLGVAKAEAANPWGQEESPCPEGQTLQWDATLEQVICK